MILAGDIGGTKTNLAYVTAHDGRLELGRSAGYPSRNHQTFQEIIGHFVAAYPQKIEAAAFGIAGPVIGGRCEATNLPWVVDAKAIGERLGGVPTALLNDLQATAYGVLRLQASDLSVLNRGEAESGGTIAVIAAGTGLGEGGLVWDGSRYLGLPSEGGHTDFAPRDELEIDLLRFMLRRHDRVSYERLISGPGLYAMYEFFRTRSGAPEPAWLREELNAGDPSAVVSRAALEGRDEICTATLDAFVSLYGAEAGNLGLKLLSRGGVYVAGGIAPKILSRIRAGAFMAAFLHKGRFSPLLERMPVSVVLNERTAILGAAHYVMMTRY